MSSILSFPGGNIPHQVFLSFVLAGLSAGAVTSLLDSIISVELSAADPDSADRTFWDGK